MITKKKQKIFLCAYQEWFDIGKACQIAGLDYADFKELMASNAVFEEVFEEIDRREVEKFMSMLLTKPTEKGLEVVPALLEAPVRDAQGL